MKKQLPLTLISILLLGWIASISLLHPAHSSIPETGVSRSPVTIQVKGSGQNLASPETTASAKTKTNSKAVGVIVPDLFALPILQQPSNQPAFVSPKPDVVTQFRMVAVYNTIGLLAHNNLAGAEFFKIQIGQPVTIVYDSGETTEYTVTAIRRFQALNPESIHSDFVDLDQPDKRLNSTELFNLVYAKGDRVVFQTCIAKGGSGSWGRIFITATPAAPVQAQGDSAGNFIQYHQIIGHISLRG